MEYVQKNSRLIETKLPDLYSGNENFSRLEAWVLKHEHTMTDEQFKELAEIMVALDDDLMDYETTVYPRG